MYVAFRGSLVRSLRIILGTGVFLGLGIHTLKVLYAQRSVFLVLSVILARAVGRTRGAPTAASAQLGTTTTARTTPRITAELY